MFSSVQSALAIANPFIVAAHQYSYGVDQAALNAVIITTVLITLGILLCVYIVNAIFLMKLFAKANVPAWKAWVPFVNRWKFFELGGYSGALSLLMAAAVIPFVGWIAACVGLVFYCMAAYQIGLKNGKDGVWVILFIFLITVWFGILGLGKSTWNDNLGKPAVGPERPPAWPTHTGGPFDTQHIPPSQTYNQ